MNLVRRGSTLLVALVIVGALAASPIGAASPAATPGTPLPTNEVTIIRDVEFAQAGGVTLTLDVYKSDRPADDRPGLILIHGGAWGSGKSQDLDDEGRLVAREGWVAFSLNYRLTGQTSNPWPDELTDVQRGIRWVGAHADTYGVDPTKLALLGVSAGGQLAIMAGEIGTAVDGTGQTIDDSDPPVAVKAVAAWSPPTRLAGLTTPSDANSPPDCGHNSDCLTFWRLPLVKSFVGCSVESCPDTYSEASPVDRVEQGTVPIWWSNGTKEIVPLVQAQTLDRALTSAHVDHQLDVIPGSGHADQDESKVWNDMMAWLALKLGAPMPPPISFAGRNLLLSPVVVISVVIGLALLIGLLAMALRDDEGSL
jgi:acetyl esterase/lipase